MVQRRRAKRPPKEVCPDGYDSKFEADLHLGKKAKGWHSPDNPQGILKNWEAHPTEPVEYIVPKKYNTDFKREIAGRIILLESKGRFWDSDEYSKYRHCRDSLPANHEIVFLFYNEELPMPGAKPRKSKGGTKLTHGEWATRNGFRWYTEETFPEELM